MNNQKVLLFAPQGFEDMEIAAFTNILGWTRILKDVTPVEVVIAALKRQVHSKHGLTIKAHILLRNARPDDYRAVVIPGGHNDRGYTEAFKKGVLDMIREIHGKGGIVATMCVGALPVGASGILKGKKATTYTLSKRHDNLQRLKDYGAVPVKGRIVVSDRIITNRGPDTAVDTAFRLVELLNGKDDVNRLKKALMFQ